jgi:UDP-N-acetylglucosamine--N-acetylmuramyl-(pentapeptide) pyrophosphoryl-undecaprenol N-acetylglucosamine transferase
VRFLLAGGGTAGHVVPALATAAALRELQPDAEVAFVGTSHGLESRMVPAAGWRLYPVQAAPLRRKLSAQAIRVPWIVWRASSDVTRLIADQSIDAACAFGGYVSGPLALGARRARIPLVVHEQNAVPGLANRLAARWACAVAASVAGTEGAFPHPERVTVTGNPVRTELVEADLAALRAEAIATFDLEAERCTVLVFGGSLGARRINEALLDTSGAWTAPSQVQVLHLTGERDHDRVQAQWAALADVPHVRCLAFVDRMELAYAAADIAVCRAGASTIAELTTAGIPSILVPYPHAAADEQTANAQALADAGAATLVADADLTPERLVELVESLVRDPVARKEAAAAARALGRPGAARAVAQLLVDAAARRTA